MTRRGKGYASAPNLLATAPGVHISAKGLFMILAAHANKQGWCWPSVKTLAAHAGMSERSVETHLRTLRDLGLVAWESRTTATGRQRFYRVWRSTDPVPEALQNLAGTLQPRQGPPLQPRQGEQEPENKNHVQQPPDADAPDVQDPPLDALPIDVPTPPPPPDEERTPHAGDLVAGWVDGYRETRGGRDPDKAALGPVAGQARRIARTRTDRESWVAAWRAFKAAGRRGDWNVMRDLLDTTPRVSTGRVNPDLANLKATAGTALALLSQTTPATPPRGLTP